MRTVARFFISNLFAFTVFLRYTAAIGLNPDPLEGWRLARPGAALSLFPPCH